MIENRFLKIKNYNTFRYHLDVLKDIKPDAIVFVEDESHRCIWAHGVEYICMDYSRQIQEINEKLDNILNGGVVVSGLGYDAFPLTLV